MKHSNASPEFPLLTEFMRGYLHEDVVPEHGNALGAATAYLADTSEQDRKKLAKEAATFRARFPLRDTRELNQVLRKMGSMWSFVSFDEFDQVLRTFEHSH